MILRVLAGQTDEEMNALFFCLTTFFFSNLLDKLPGLLLDDSTAPPGMLTLRLSCS